MVASGGRSSSGLVMRRPWWRRAGSAMMASAAPGMTATDTSEATEDVATVYAPVGAPIRFRDTVTVPAGHPMAGDWLVDSRPAHWPLGVVATMTRR